jgi:hypothetical protein
VLGSIVCLPTQKAKLGPTTGQEIIMQALILALLQRQPVRRHRSVG